MTYPINMPPLEAQAGEIMRLRALVGTLEGALRPFAEINALLAPAAEHRAVPVIFIRGAARAADLAAKELTP